jgi:hypothetical protein
MTRELASVSVLEPGLSSAAPSEEEVDMCGGDLVPVELLRVWEGVYREYVATSRLMDAGDAGKREVLSRLSAQVAVTWRRMADSLPGGEWFEDGVVDGGGGDGAPGA